MLTPGISSDVRAILRNAAKIWTTWGGDCAKFVCGVTFARRERHDWQMKMTPASTGGFGGMCRDRGLLLGKSMPRLQPSGARMPHKVVIAITGLPHSAAPFFVAAPSSHPVPIPRELLGGRWISPEPPVAIALFLGGLDGGNRRISVGFVPYEQDAPAFGKLETGKPLFRN